MPTPILVDQRQHALEPTKPDDRVHLHLRPHAGRTLQDASANRLAPPSVDITNGESRLGPFGSGHRLNQGSGGTQSVGEAGLVKVDVGIQESRYDHASRGLDLVIPGPQPRPNRRDHSAVD